MLAYLQGGRYGDKTILSPETSDEMHATAFRLDPRMPGMALGFYHVNANGLDAFGHGGDTNYCHTEMLLIPSAWRRPVPLLLHGRQPGAGSGDGRVYRPLFPRRECGREADKGVEARSSPLSVTRAVINGPAATHSKVEKLLNLFGQIAMAPLPDGNLVIGGLWPEPKQFRPVEQNLWRQIGGRAQIAFRTDSAGNSTHMFFDFLPFMPTERVPCCTRSRPPGSRRSAWC